MFEVTRADDGLIFNPYVKTKCVLKEDGFILFEGYLRMIDVKDKEGEISYNVNLYSEVVALADVLKDATFSELDFTELEHDYNKTQIKYSWNDAGTGITYLNPSTSGFRDAYSTLKYPFIDWGHQYLIGGSTTTIATSGNPELTTLEQAFRPCIQLKYLINRIFAASGFNYTSNFFNTTDFGKLYMDFNWGSDNNPIEVGATTFGTYYFYTLGDGSASNYATNSFSVMYLSYNIPLIGGMFPPNYNNVSNIVTSTVINESYTVNYAYSIENIDTVAREIECRWLYNTTPIDNTPPIGSNTVITIPPGGDYLYSGNFTQVMGAAGSTLQVQFKTDSGTASKVRQSQILFPDNGAYVQWVVGVDAVASQTILQTLRGELGQWDFLKGIMTMFNLVSMVDENDPDNILIEPYSDIFITNPNSKRLDWTEKIDASEMELRPLTDLNKNTIFQFVEDEDDYVFKVYKNSTSGHLYGSKEIDASGFTILEGTKEIIAEPFAATVSKPLDDYLPSFVVPSIYAMTDDGTSESFDNSPRIFYNNGIKSTGASYFIPTQNGVTGENQLDFLQFSHLTDVPTIAGSRDFVFESQQLFQPIGNSPTDNLYSIYWQPYFNELYNADTRTMTLKVNLNPSDVASFKFYDTVFIKNRAFRVNKIEYKPNDLATVEFILIP